MFMWLCLDCLGGKNNSNLLLHSCHCKIRRLDFLNVQFTLGSATLFSVTLTYSSSNVFTTMTQDTIWSVDHQTSVKKSLRLLNMMWNRRVEMFHLYAYGARVKIRHHTNSITCSKEYIHCTWLDISELIPLQQMLKMHPETRWLNKNRCSMLCNIINLPWISSYVKKKRICLSPSFQKPLIIL